MELRMKKDEAYVLSAEERHSLIAEIMELLEEYDYNPTESAINTIIDEWVKNKGWMINLFKKHPNYNGKYQIVFDADYDRTCNKDIVQNFAYYFLETSRKSLLQEVRVSSVYTYREIDEIRYRLGRIRKALDIIDDVGYYGTANGRSFAEITKEFNFWDAKQREIVDNPNYIVKDSHVYNREKYLLYENANRFYYRILYDYRDAIATEGAAIEINRFFPTIKAVEGQKMSRIVNKICKLLGVDKDANYNKEFANYSDTINPLAIKRHTILSCHPVDYLTMSFGNSWASCHTIDKANRRGMPDNYSGCYSSGTISYMLDDSSFVFYTVSKEYEGDKYELQDKINRNMFHMGEEKLIQARVYPQSTDSANGIYKQIREIAQKVISDCLEVPNMWKNVKGTSACRNKIASYGTHYRDYSRYGDCNVSYLKRDEDDVVNETIIRVGSDPICVQCGHTHHSEQAIECRDCYGGQKATCNRCGSIHNIDLMHNIDGDYYCDCCCFYCDYHDEYEVGDYTYVINYGNVCYDALANGNFDYCEHCDEWYYDREGISTSDGNWYCSESCAKSDEYMKASDNKWYPEDDVYYCDRCGNYVHLSHWNNELECCDDCEDIVLAEREGEEE